MYPVIKIQILTRIPNSSRLNTCVNKHFQTLDALLKENFYKGIVRVHQARGFTDSSDGMKLFLNIINRITKA